MPVISFANAKGGAGKTTAALLLATELAHQGFRVTVIDGDPQRWISQWFETSGHVRNIEVISEVTIASLQCHLREMGPRTDYFIIDLAGARDALVTTAIGLSDHVMIPVQGSAMDARGAAQILDLLSFLKEKANLDIAHSVVLTRVTSMVTTKALLMIKGLLAARGVHVLDTPIGERIAFKELFEIGGTLHTLDPAKVSNVDKAKENARAFAEEVMRLMPAKVIRTGAPRIFGFRRSAA
ncbi:ParA family protein [Neorhizobium petrolearium]|uniref:ParA family protein n=1 Tax=Neorhizobium petrolearium TaxID=515361 RepID=A0ABY8MAA1_9HYPH|nr:ParA family protein [Neorhizobium petrolearium]MCC2610451.1 ParA family protein [Neorhizobium petrolearium]WGI70594.1 ParA family protein [Neorhizobium petrolearium]